MFMHNDIEGAPQRTLTPDAQGQLQGNLLHSAKGTHSTQEFVCFESAGALRKWLLDCNQELRNPREASHNLLLTAQGLRKLGVSEDVLAAMDPAFLRGARHEQTRQKLRDPRVRDWQSEHQTAWDAAFLTKRDAHVQARLPAYHEGYRSFTEYGASLGKDLEVLTDPEAAKYTHFGYRDGLSDPIFVSENDEPLASGADMRRKLSVLLVRDPLATPSTTCFGSYFVFRKYRLDVKAFEEAVKGIVAELLSRYGSGPEGEEHHIPDQASRFPFFQNTGTKQLERDEKKLAELVKEWIMGRNSEGENTQWGPGNGFSHADDPNGTRCPFHAHIRKMNPRGATGDLEFEHSKTLTRRGISYGSKSSQKKGLLFWCAQASIENQFEYVQQRWANHDGIDFDRRPTPELDALIGRPAPAARFENVVREYPEKDRYTRWKSTIDVNFDVWDASQLVASEYFFAPSLAGLEQLCTVAQRGQGGES